MEVRGYLEGWFKFWEDVRAEVLAVDSVSETVVTVTVRVTVLGRESSLEVTDDWGHVMETQRNRIVRAILCRTPREARSLAERGSAA